MEGRDQKFLAAYVSSCGHAVLKPTRTNMDPSHLEKELLVCFTRVDDLEVTCTNTRMLCVSKS